MSISHVIRILLETPNKKLAPGINCARLKLRRYVPRGGQRGGNFKLPPIRNGQITTSVCLARALQYFAGGSAYNLVSTYGISQTDVMDSVWQVVVAVNNLSEFQISYPLSVLLLVSTKVLLDLMYLGGQLTASSFGCRSRA